MKKLFERSGVAIGAFLLGALLVVSAQQVGASLLLNNYTLNTTSNTTFGPSTAPPNGDISPTVTSLTVLDELQVRGDIINLGKETIFDQSITVRGIKGYDRTGQNNPTALNVNANTYTNESDTQIFNYKNSNFGADQFATTSISGDLTVSGNLGSYVTVSKNRSFRATNFGDSAAVMVSCPTGKQLVSCSGYINDSYNNHTFQGTFAYPIDGYQSCTTKAIANKNSHVGTNDTVIFAAATCFDPRGSADPSFYNI